METVTEKQVLNQEELKALEDIQNQTQQLVMHLGEIEITKLQLNKKYKEAGEKLDELEKVEKQVTDSLLSKYGNVSINPENGEITKLD
tara:strand:+ start:1008 stop:1271 length:264 start_codon:yes stop_codon:yes gene_type:complete